MSITFKKSACRPTLILEMISLRAKFRDLTGERFGRLVVIGRAEKVGNHRLWRCLCDCGQISSHVGSNLKKGSTNSCGCFRREFASQQAVKRFTKHGNAVRGKQSPEHRAWVDMRHRCENENLEAYRDYGGRGISVCARWKTFDLFLADMGKRPSAKHSIDRIDVNGNYEPGNCRWATKSVQSHNKRAKSNTGELCISWCESRKAYAWAVSKDGQKLRGREKTMDLAIKKRDAAIRKLYGENA